MRGAEVLAGVLAVGLLFAIVPAGPVWAFGVSYPDVAAMASGTRTDVVSLLQGAPPSWLLEAADRELFGGVGLRESGARTRLALGHWRLALEAASLRAAPGVETRFAAHAGVSSSWTVLVGVVHDTAAIAGFPPARRTTLAMRTGASLLDRLQVHCDVTGFRIAGVGDPEVDDRGADIATGVTVVAAGGIALTTVVSVDRWTGAHARASAAVRVPGGAVVVGGYDDETASLSLAVAVAAQRLLGTAAVSAHPVLGLSRGISVGWGR